MKNLRNFAAIVLLTTFAYACDADATLDETQENTIEQNDIIVADGGGDEQNETDGKD